MKAVCYQRAAFMCAKKNNTESSQTMEAAHKETTFNAGYITYQMPYRDIPIGRFMQFEVSTYLTTIKPKRSHNNHENIVHELPSVTMNWLPTSPNGVTPITFDCTNIPTKFAGQDFSCLTEIRGIDSKMPTEPQTVMIHAEPFDTDTWVSIPTVTQAAKRLAAKETTTPEPKVAAPKIWFTADLHLGDHAVATQYRKFDSASQHDEVITTMWRNTVGANDIVYVLGDISSGKTDSQINCALDTLAKLPGRKRLIAGNHDPIAASNENTWDHTARFAKVFEGVRDTATVTINGKKVLLNHYPYQNEKTKQTFDQFRLKDFGAWLIHGHIHDNEQFHDNRQIHVGLDAWWFNLVAEQSIAGIIDHKLRQEKSTHKPQNKQQNKQQGH